MNRNLSRPVLEAIAAAVLFGASAPLAKILLDDVEPIPLAAFLYLGSGLGLMLFRGVHRRLAHVDDREAKIRRSDLPWLIGAIFAGGIAAPIILMFGLRATPASTASLLLNFEGVATTLIAGLAFREALGRRTWWAVALITLAGILLSWETGEWGISPGMLGVLGACILWGIDNNFTRNISAKDPVAIVTVKGVASGAFSLTLALALGNSLPDFPTVLGAMALGSLCYGLSIVLFVRAMRSLGAARTGALFGTAPFVGAALSFPLCGEAVSIKFLMVLPLTVTGVALLTNEEHDHLHHHKPVDHEHRHRHDDEHHIHRHTKPGWNPALIHVHSHIHEQIEHLHPHTPDIHHRHTH
ncbi:MAG TPA: DMT family transporter [Chloroflexi bacterium]|nr:DMT family transporter [Chloroflexota bacterium]